MVRSGSIEPEEVIPNKLKQPLTVTKRSKSKGGLLQISFFAQLPVKYLDRGRFLRLRNF